MPSLLGHSSWLLAQIYSWLSKPMGHLLHPRCQKEIKMTLFTLNLLCIYILRCVKENEKCPRIQGVIWFLPDVLEGLVKTSNEREGFDPPWTTIPKVSFLKEWLWIFSMLNFGVHEYKSKHWGGGGGGTFTQVVSQQQSWFHI